MNLMNLVNTRAYSCCGKLDCKNGKLVRKHVYIHSSLINDWIKTRSLPSMRIARDPSVSAFDIDYRSFTKISFLQPSILLNEALLVARVHRCSQIYINMYARGHCEWQWSEHLGSCQFPSFAMAQTPTVFVRKFPL
jgi:hypothetical protein